MALRKQAARNKEETPAMVLGDAREIFVHRNSAAGGSNNLRFFQPKRSPVFSHFWEALIFWYFWIKPKVQKVKKGNLLGTCDILLLSTRWLRPDQTA
jgi:hypothetical protein